MHDAMTTLAATTDRDTARVALACTWLFVPGNRSERFHKALDAGADMVILDLEDAVAPGDKTNAHSQITSAWTTFDATQRARLAVRINPVGTPWHADECAWLAQLAGLGAVVLPKAEDAQALARIAASQTVVPLIESAIGVDQARALASVPGVCRLALGHIDLQADLGMRCGSDESELTSIRVALVLASRLARIAPPIDGVTMDTRAPETWQHDAQRARRLGFGGKLCIHPSQVAGVQAAFTPTAQELDWARRVMDALAAAQGGVCTVDQKMVDAPVRKLAEQTLQRFHHQHKETT